MKRKSSASRRIFFSYNTTNLSGLIKSIENILTCCNIFILSWKNYLPAVLHDASVIIFLFAIIRKQVVSSAGMSASETVIVSTTIVSSGVVYTSSVRSTITGAGAGLGAFEAGAGFSLLA